MGEPELAVRRRQDSLPDLIRSGRAIAEYAESDYAYIAVGTDEKPAEVQTREGEILRGRAVFMYGKHPKTPKVNLRELV